MGSHPRLNSIPGFPTSLNSRDQFPSACEKLGTSSSTLTVLLPITRSLVLSACTHHTFSFILLCQAAPALHFPQDLLFRTNIWQVSYQPRRQGPKISYGSASAAHHLFPPLPLDLAGGSGRRAPNIHPIPGLLSCQFSPCIATHAFYINLAFTQADLLVYSVILSITGCVGFAGRQQNFLSV